MEAIMLKKGSISFNVLGLLVGVFFVASMLLVDLLKIDISEAAELNLPEPTTILALTQDFATPIVKGVRFDPANPLELEFIFDSGESSKINDSQVKQMIEYFLAGLIMDEEDLWVNLSPYESDRILINQLEQTQIGKDLLSQDYILKQLSSSLTHPDSEIGNTYWQDLQFDFNKVWISPDSANMFEDGTAVYIIDSKLKVESQEDYLARSMNTDNDKKSNDVDNFNVLLSSLSKEVNKGKHFVKLRQIYNSLLLSSWFKQKFKNTFYKALTNSKDIEGIEINNSDSKEKIFKLYVDSFNKGVFNFYKKENDSTGKKVKKHYFSGGATMSDVAGVQNYQKNITIAQKMFRASLTGNSFSLTSVIANKRIPRFISLVQNIKNAKKTSSSVQSLQESYSNMDVKLAANDIFDELAYLVSLRYPGFKIKLKHVVKLLRSLKADPTKRFGPRISDGYVYSGKKTMFKVQKWSESTIKITMADFLGEGLGNLMNFHYDFKTRKIISQDAGGNIRPETFREPGKPLATSFNDSLRESIKQEIQDLNVIIDKINLFEVSDVLPFENLTLAIEEMITGEDSFSNVLSLINNMNTAWQYDLKLLDALDAIQDNDKGAGVRIIAINKQDETKSFFYDLTFEKSKLGKLIEKLEEVQDESFVKFFRDLLFAQNEYVADGVDKTNEKYFHGQLDNVFIQYINQNGIKLPYYLRECYSWDYGYNRYYELRDVVGVINRKGEYERRYGIFLNGAIEAVLKSYSFKQQGDKLAVEQKRTSSALLLTNNQDPVSKRDGGVSFREIDSIIEPYNGYVADAEHIVRLSVVSMSDLKPFEFKEIGI